MAERPFEPTASLETLRQRAWLLARVRQFFDSRGFFEVQTPVLSADTVVDRHLEPMSLKLSGTDSGNAAWETMWLQTSPEFAMKRLMAAGARAIYQIGPAFRRGERGDLHNPEFTMLEWYRAGDDYRQGMQLLSDLAEEILQRGSASLLTYRNAFLQHTNIDPFRTDVEQIKDWCQRHAISWPSSLPSHPLDDWLDLVMVHAVQPALGHREPVILHDYPPSQAALARLRTDEIPVAERFEMLVDGIEIANGYHELCDADALLARNVEANAQRIEDGNPPLPTDSTLITAMRAGLPSCSGVAVGMDRLAMICFGMSKIDDVMTFPIERA